jgi:azurin
MAHETEHTSHHPSFKQYVLIAIILFAITIVEFLLIWDRVGIADDLGASKIPLLVGLSAVKFAIVIMFYMHLKFDNRLFGTIFVSGLVLAFLVGIALLGLFVGFGGGQRTYAEDRAIPYEHEEGGHETVEEGDETGDTTPPPVSSGPLVLPLEIVGDSLAFDISAIEVDSGAELIITLNNPSSTNSHNLVIVQDGTKDAVATDGTAAGPANNWVPPDDPRVIANTVLLGPGENGEVSFTAPAPGTYQFVCTFPGHNFTMFGDLIVR